MKADIKAKPATAKGIKRNTLKFGSTRRTLFHEECMKRRGVQDDINPLPSWGGRGFVIDGYALSEKPLRGWMRSLRPRPPPRRVSSATPGSSDRHAERSSTKSVGSGAERKTISPPSAMGRKGVRHRWICVVRKVRTQMDADIKAKPATAKGIKRNTLKF